MKKTELNAMLDVLNECSTKIMLHNECIGIVGEPSPFKDVEGKPLKVGDCVNDGTPHNSFIAHDGDYGFYVMGWGMDGEHLNKPLRKVNDYDHEYFHRIRIVPDDDLEALEAVQ